MDMVRTPDRGKCPKSCIGGNGGGGGTMELMGFLVAPEIAPYPAPGLCFRTGVHEGCYAGSTTGEISGWAVKNDWIFSS